MARHRKNYPCSGKVRHRRVSWGKGKNRVTFTVRDCKHKPASKKQAAWWKKFGAAAAKCHKAHDPGTKGMGTCMRKSL